MYATILKVGFTLVLPALARFFQGFSNQTPEAGGLEELYHTCSAGKPPSSPMLTAIQVFAVFDAIVQGIILAGSELGKRLTAEEAKPLVANNKNLFLSFVTASVTAVTAFNGVQDFLEDCGADTPASIAVGVIVGVFAGYSSYRFTLDRTIQAESLKYWPSDRSQRAQFVGSALIGNASQALMTFYQLYRVSQKMELNFLATCLVDTPITLLFLLNFNQTQIRLMGNRLIQGKSNKAISLTRGSQGCLLFLKGMSFLNVVSAPAMLLTLFTHLISKDQKTEPNPIVLGFIIGFGIIGGINAALLTIVFRMPSVADLLQKCESKCTRKKEALLLGSSVTATASSYDQMEPVSNMQ